MPKVENNPCILLLDQDTQRKNIQSSRLRVTTGVEVEIGKGAFHALHLLERDRYTMMLIFENPSDMPADELIGLVREMHPKENLPILYFSKNRTTDDITEKIDRGVNEYIFLSDKYNFGQLVNKINGYLGK